MESESSPRSSYSNVCLTVSLKRSADERVLGVIRTNLAGCSFDGLRSRCCLRGLRPFLQPCQGAWHPNSPGFRTTQAIERKLLLPEVMALIVWCALDFTLERGHGQHHNILQIRSSRDLSASPRCSTVPAVSPLWSTRPV